MAVKSLTKEDLWDYVIGATVLATGGGGIAPPYEVFSEAVDEVLRSDVEIQLIEPAEVPDDALVFMGAGAGGGVSMEVKTRYMAYPSFEDRFMTRFSFTEWIRGQIKWFEKTYPLPSWAEVPDSRWSEAAERRLVKILNKEPFAYMLSEIGPLGFYTMCSAALKGRVVVDGDVSGYRAVPEYSLSTLNVFDIKPTPAVLTTPWGDMVVIEKVLSWQRFEDINRSLAIVSGGEVGGVIAVKGDELKKAVVSGSVSKSIEIGKAIREAREKSDDPVEAIIKVTGGYKLFEGVVTAYIREEKWGFIWGESRFEGVNEFKGHRFKVWFKNENQISWFDDEPFVTCPDLNVWLIQ